MGLLQFLGDLVFETLLCFVPTDVEHFARSRLYRVRGSLEEGCVLRSIALRELHQYA